MSSARNTQNRIKAISVAASTIPPKPNMAATMATTRNNSIRPIKPSSFHRGCSDALLDHGGLPGAVLLHGMRTFTLEPVVPAILLDVLFDDLVAGDAARINDVLVHFITGTGP